MGRLIKILRKFKREGIDYVDLRVLNEWSKHGIEITDIKVENSLRRLL